MASKPTGRPRIEAYDSLSKNCERCGAPFFLRDKPFQSFGRFQKRRFCSTECAGTVAGQPNRDHKAWILERVEKSESGCWVWQRDKGHNGYGLASALGRRVRVHRYAYEIWKGPIPEGMMVLHSCDNRPCCNPDHLSVGTARDNMQDAIRKGRAPQFTRNRKPRNGSLAA